RVFARRLLLPSPQPAIHLKPLVEVDQGPRQVFNDLLFFYSACSDSLVRDFTVDRYWPAVSAGQSTLSNAAAAEFIWEAEQDGRIPRRWSEEIRHDMAGRLLGMLTDFGMLERHKPTVCRIPEYRPADATVLYLAQLLHARGVPDGLLGQQPEWAIFG